jgi:D-beta-D-heptose 7-phosphate kinase/D-beta-D-heptose 1-phosphate adenosyltransferase
VLVKGGDYKVKEIVGYKEVIANGGTVATIDLVEGLSTSKIISKLA